MNEVNPIVAVVFRKYSIDDVSVVVNIGMTVLNGELITHTLDCCGYDEHGYYAEYGISKTPAHDDNAGAG